MKLSFGMIFSIFLIIAFIAFAFYAITKFINLQKTIQVETFIENLQNDIDNMWKSAKGSQEETYSLPKKIDSVCFTDNEFNNLMFRSSGIFEERNINHLDIAEITLEEDPYCIPNINGKIKLTISKDFGKELIIITE